MTADDESHGAAVIDIIEKRMQENAALREENRRLREALLFYSEPENWRSHIRRTPEFMLNGRSRRDAYYAGPECTIDGGSRARRALESDNANP